MKTKLVIVMTVLVALWILVSASQGQGQKRKRPLSQADIAALEKRIVELERKVAPFVKELQELRQKLAAQYKVTVIPLRHADAREIYEILTEVYRDSSPPLSKLFPKRKRTFVQFEALRKMSCVAVRADAKTTREIINLVGELDEAAKRVPKQEKAISGSP